jgi:hypothetical protein
MAFGNKPSFPLPSAAIQVTALKRRNSTCSPPASHAHNQLAADAAVAISVRCWTDLLSVGRAADRWRAVGAPEVCP